MVNQPSLFEAIVTGKPVKEFFNTINLAGQDLQAAKQQTAIQDNRVLEIFKRMGKLTPLEASREYDRLYPAAPITSIRRSITVLTRHDKLKKLDQMKREVYGKVNHLWAVE